MLLKAAQVNLQRQMELQKEMELQLLLARNRLAPSTTLSKTILEA
jgi:hypothetical protein